MQQEKTRKQKKAKALLTIKEFSEICDLEPSTLRYWDEIGLFQPACRNEDNNYRFYSPEQIVMVNYIKVLSNLNVPLKTIVDMNEKRSPEAILGLLKRQEAILNSKLNLLHESFSTIYTLREVIRQGIEVTDAKHVSVQTLEAMPIMLGPRNEAREELDFFQAFARYCQFARENRINLNYPIGGYYESLEQCLISPAIPSRFFSVDPRGVDRRVDGKYLVGYAQGYYGQLGDVGQRMEKFAAQHDLHMHGPVYAISMHNEISVKDTSQYLAQICAAIGPAGQ